MLKRLLIFSFVALLCCRASAQMVGDNVFLPGGYLQICVSPNGSFGNTVNPPASYSGGRISTFYADPITCATPTAANDLAESYDQGHDGWAVGVPYPWYGDYTLPGSPWEGWCIEVGGVQQNAWFTDLGCGTLFSSTGAITMTGGVTGYSSTPSSCGTHGAYTAYYQGACSGVNINMQTTVDTGASWVICTVVFKNTTGAAINNIYYMRTCDPDNDEDMGGGFPTYNTIQYNEPLAGTGNRVMVTAQGEVLNNCYLGLCTRDCRAIAYISSSWPLFSGYTADQYYAGPTSGLLTGVTYTQGAFADGDIAIGIVYNIGTLAAGDSTIISYAYTFDPGPGAGLPIHTAPGMKQSLDSAFPNPQLLVNCAAPTHGITANNDTINVCTYVGPTINVNVMGANTGLWTNSIWTWSPATGLASSTGLPNTITISLLTSLVTTYTITGVTNLRGSSCPMYDTFYVTVVLCSGALANTPCVGDSLLLQCIGDTTGFPTYSWTGPAGFTSNIRNPNVFPTTWADTGIYYVTKTIAGIATTYSVDATFNPLPVVNLTTNAPFCFGSVNDTLLLGVTPVSAGETFVWSGPSGFTSTSANPVMDTFSGFDNGFYVVTATLPTGCVYTDSIFSGLMPPPPPPTITGDTVYCFGQNFMPFNPISVLGDSIMWYPNDTGLRVGGTTVPPSINTTIPGYYTFYARQVPGGCYSPMDSITVHVYPQIVPYFYNYLYRGCNTDDIVLVNASENASLFTWNFGDGSTVVNSNSSTDTVYHTYSPIGNYTATLTANNPDPACTILYSVQVDSVHPIQAIIQLHRDTQCVGIPINFDASTSLVGFNGLTYAWNFNDGNVGNAAINPHTYYQAGVYTVQLTVTDALGCTSTADTSVIAISIKITSFKDTTVCLTASMPLFNYITLYPKNVISYDSVTYLWALPGGPVYGIDNPYAQIPNFFDTGVFYFSYSATINDWGCTAIHEYTITSMAPPKFTNITPPQNIKIGESVQLNSMMNITAGNGFYWWTPNDGTISNPDINDPVATPKQTTDYIVHGEDSWGCIILDTVHVEVDSTIIDNIPSGFTPNGDGLNDYFCPFNQPFDQIVDFRVYNRWGDEVYHSAGYSKGWDGTYNGTPQDMGVYNYIIILAHPDGSNVRYKGTVSLIR